MRTGGIRRGDIVHLDIRGWRTFAEVVKPVHKDNGRRVLEVKPLEVGLGTPLSLPSRRPTPRQVIGHYAKRKG